MHTQGNASGAGRGGRRIGSRWVVKWGAVLVAIAVWCFGAPSASAQEATPEAGVEIVAEDTASVEGAATAIYAGSDKRVGLRLSESPDGPCDVQARAPAAELAAASPVPI